jgi:hypothetical protein
VSRYEWTKDNFTFSIGWDPPLATFFAQIQDNSIPEDSAEENVIVWLGADRSGQFPELDLLLDEFSEHLDDGKIPENLKLHLNADKKKTVCSLEEFPLPETIRKLF